MSFTSNFLTKLAAFDAINTGTFYPELAKIKYLLLDSNRDNTFIYTYKSGGAGYFQNILSNLQMLFPNMFIYYNTTNSQNINDVDVKYFLNAQISVSSSVYTMFISSTLLDKIVFSYTTTNTSITNDNVIANLPLLFVANVFEQVGTPIVSVVTNGLTTVTVTVTVNCSYNNASTLEGIYGLSFNTNFYNNVSISNINIITLNNIPLSKLGLQFFNLQSISITKGQNPIIRTNTSLASCFMNCTNFNSDISGWNTANVINMNDCFRNCPNFNSDISGWNTANVTDMTGCFRSCTNFNSDISGWNTANVTNMNYCFYYCNNFNSNLSGWNTSKVIKLISCFDSCYKFNSNLSGWITAAVTDLNSCLGNCSIFNNGFNAGVSNTLTWNTANVSNMSYCFYKCINFNSNLSGWTTSKVTIIAHIFAGAGYFNNGDVSGGISNQMPWNLTGLSGTLSQTTSTSPIYNWRGGISSAFAVLTAANAPAALTTGTPGSLVFL